MNLNVIYKVIKFIKENVSKYLCNLGLSKDFWDKISEAQFKNKKGKLVFIKIENTYYIKYTDKRIEM